MHLAHPGLSKRGETEGKLASPAGYPAGTGARGAPGWRKPAATTEHVDPVAEVLWVGDWEVVEGSPGSFEKALRVVSSRLPNNAARIAAGPVGEFSRLA